MNIDITIGVTPQLEKVLEGLASLIGGTQKSILFTESLPQDQTIKADQIVTNAPVQQQAPIQQPIAPPVQQAPMQQPLTTAVPTAPVAPPVQQQALVQPQAVPTMAPTYDMNQLAVAATQLMDAGKQPQLLELLASFGAQSLMDVSPTQYGTFATKLRELGAKI